MAGRKGGKKGRGNGVRPPLAGNPESPPGPGDGDRPAAGGVSPAVPEIRKRKGPGRPRDYGAEVEEEILGRLAEGEALAQICEDPEMPTYRAVSYWLAGDRPDFARRYWRIIQTVRPLLWADEIVRIADGAPDPDNPDERDVLWGPKGPVPNSARVARDKLRVDARRWLLAKMVPKVFGDRVHVEGETRIIHQLSELPAREAARLALLPDDELREELARLRAGGGPQQLLPKGGEG